jgi:iron-sulfur cluster repair protein YtfE (RIC family)
MAEVDDKFFNRADAHIHLANEQLADASKGKVSASMMYGVARFNAYISAAQFNSKEDLKKEKDDIIEYFLKSYKQMLNEHLDDYINNFDQYLSNP